MTKIFPDKNNIINVSRFDILISPWFIIGLMVLIINDHLLKAAFPGLITGKLSDLAGLFIFPLFIVAFIPKRKLLIYILTFVLFILWKLPLADGFIEIWNKFPFFNIGRTVDYTDYIALAILPLSYFYYPKNFLIHYRKLSVSMVAIIAFIAFCATSPERDAVKVEGYNNGFSQQKSSRVWCEPNQNICIIKDYESTNYRGYRLIDSNGIELNGQQYAVIKLFQNDQLLISSGGDYESKDESAAYTGGSWGIMTYRGKVIIKPTYEKIDTFSAVNKMFKGKVEDRWSLMDSTGNTIIEPVFDYFYALNNHLIAVKLRGKLGIVDMIGNFIIPIKIDKINKSSTSDSINLLINGKWQSIDALGN